MSIDKMRDDFEAAYKAACLNRSIPRFDKDHSGDYLNPFVQSAWWGWQASRESLVIELPDPRQTLAGPSLYAQFKEAVEASGLKVTT